MTGMFFHRLGTYLMTFGLWLQTRLSLRQSYCMVNTWIAIGSASMLKAELAQLRKEIEKATNDKQ